MLSRRRAAAASVASSLVAAVVFTGGTAQSAVASSNTSARQAAAVTPTTLSVFAYNADLGTSVIDWSQNEQAARRTPIIESIIRAHSADVVILDEAFNNSSVSNINSNLAALYPYRTPVVGASCYSGWTAISGDCSNSPFVINGGTEILSKYPISAEYAHVFSNSTSGTWDYNANKGAALVEVNKAGDDIWVVGTHLQADQSGTSTNTTQATRLGQLGEIRSWVNGIVGSSAPVLIGGDLNVEYFHGQTRGDYVNAESAVGGVLGTPATDPSQTLTTMDCPVSTWCQYMSGIESFANNYQDDLDYLGYLNAPGRPTPASLPTVGIDFDPQSGWAAGQLDTNAPSDHYPVQATFQIS